MHPTLHSINYAKEFGSSLENIEDLRRRMTVQGYAFSRRQVLLTYGKGIAAVFSFNLPGQVSAGYLETLALSRFYLPYTFGCRDVL